MNEVVVLLADEFVACVQFVQKLYERFRQNADRLVVGASSALHEKGNGRAAVFLLLVARGDIAVKIAVAQFDFLDRAVHHKLAELRKVNHALVGRA